MVFLSPTDDTFAGPSLAQWRDSNRIWKFPVDMARGIAAQIIWELAYIHSCGVIHSNLHFSNILFKLDNQDDATREKIYGLPRMPIPNDLKPPRYCIPPVGMHQSSEDSIKGARIMISDFGEAFFKDKPPKELRTPTLLLPPEYIFHEPITQAIYVWILTHLLYKILGQSRLFGGFYLNQDDTVGEMISTLGPVPNRWWDRWESKTQFFHDDASWRVTTYRMRYARSLYCLLSGCATWGEGRIRRRVSSDRGKWLPLRSY